MGPTIGKLVRYAVLVTSFLGIVLVCFFLFNLIGSGDSLGEASNNCARQDFPSASNGAGKVATAHAVDCTYGLAHGADTTFIYVRKSELKDDGKSLVFRFDNFGTSGEPQMTWNGNSDLLISIPEVGEVTKQLDSMDGTKITYSTGKIDLSPGDYRRATRRYAEILLVLLVFLIAVCGLSIRSIRKLSPKT
jgi:hypothetical protein